MRDFAELHKQEEQRTGTENYEENCGENCYCWASSSSAVEKGVDYAVDCIEVDVVVEFQEQDWWL